MRRRRSRQVEIFNFSFLDILACTIGLLIFIMVMVFVLQSGSPVANARAIMDKSVERANEIRSQARRDDEIAARLEAQLEQIHFEIDPQVIAQRDAAKLLRNSARAVYEEKARILAQARATLQGEVKSEQESQAQQLADAQTRLVRARSQFDSTKGALATAKADAREAADTRFLPHAQSRADADRYQILHLDCRANEVVLFEVSGDGTAKELGHSRSGDLGEGSDFAVIMAKHRDQLRPLVLFWIRPDGEHTFEKAVNALPAGMDRGYEPADADWKLVGGALP